MKLLFRTRGGPIQGWGNVYRLASFADYCRTRLSATIGFLVEGPPEVHAFLEGRGFTVISLPEDLTVEAEHRYWQEQGPVDCIIMEMLEVTYERQAMLRAHAPRVVVFDDLCDHRYCADLVVCGQALPSTANRDLSAAHCKFLVGPDYFLSRPEFLDFSRQPRTHSETVQRVLVTLGGGRYDVGFEKAARALAALSHPIDEVVFVLGPANLDRLGPRIRQLLPEATVLGGIDDMAQRLWECDLAIVSAGYSKLEAALLGTPSVMMSVQWHQIPLAACFSPRSSVPDLGYMSYTSVASLKKAICDLLPRQARELQAHQARSTVDGRGFERVFDAIFQLPLPESA